MMLGDMFDKSIIPIEETEEPVKKLTIPKSYPKQIPPPKVGRNSPCPCGSGIKYKKCCMGKPREDFANVLDFLEGTKKKDQK